MAISPEMVLARLVERLESVRVRPRMWLDSVEPKTCIAWLSGLRAGFAICVFDDWPTESRWRTLEARGLEMEARWEDDQLASRGLGPEEIVDELLAIEIEMWKGMTPDEIEAACRPIRPLREWIDPQAGDPPIKSGDRFGLIERTFKGSNDPDSLVDDLLESNASFQELVEKSKASPRRPFTGNPEA